MRMTLAVVLVGAAVSACSPATSAERAGTSAAPADQTAPFVAWLDEQFARELEAVPERATRLGSKQNYDKLNDYTEAGQDRVLEWRRRSVAEMKQKFDRASL